jgi:phage/plasmid-like protein (TIGR03299 family)
MAHNLYYDQTANRHAMFSADTDAWHKLGKVTLGAQTAEQAAEMALLNFELIKVQMSFESMDLTQGMVPDKVALLRSDTGAYVATVGKDFGVVQPSKAFAFCDALVGTGQASYESAGLLGERGTRMWLLLRVPKADFTIGGQDEHRTYLAFAQGFDGSMLLSSYLTNVRIVCQNTLIASFSGACSRFATKHTKNVEARMDAAIDYFAQLADQTATTKQRLEFLLSRRVTRESLTAVLDRLFPIPAGKTERATRSANNIDAILRRFEANDNNAFPSQRGTAYNLLQAMTGYADHERGVRDTDGQGEAANRAESALFGSGQAFKSQALSVILEESETMPSMLTAV